MSVWRSRRLRAAAAIVAVSVVPGGAAARSADAAFPPDVEDQGALAVLSNAQCSVTPTAKAKQVTLTSWEVTAPPGEKTAVVWAPACTRRQQAVVFSREVDIPGVPASALF